MVKPRLFSAQGPSEAQISALVAAIILTDPTIATLAKEATVTAGFAAGAKEATVTAGFAAGAKEATVTAGFAAAAQEATLQLVKAVTDALPGALALLATDANMAAGFAAAALEATSQQIKLRTDKDIYGTVTNATVPSTTNFSCNLTQTDDHLNGRYVMFLDGNAMTFPIMIQAYIGPVGGDDANIDITGYNSFPLAPTVGDHFLVLADSYVDQLAATIAAVTSLLTYICEPPLTAMMGCFNLTNALIASGVTPTTTRFNVNSYMRPGSMVIYGAAGKTRVVTCTGASSPYTITVFPPLASAPTIGNNIYNLYETGDLIGMPWETAPAKAVLISDNPRAYNPTEVNTTSESEVCMKRIQTVLPPTPYGGLTDASTVHGLKLHVEAKYEAGGSGNCRLAMYDAAGAIRVASLDLPIAGDVYGDLEQSFFLTDMDDWPQPFTFAVLLKTTTSGKAVYARNFDLRYDLTEYLPVACDNP